MTSNYTIPRKYITSHKIKYNEWSYQGSYHPAPKGHWVRSQLSNATHSTMTPSTAFQKMLVTSDKRTVTRGNKVYELGKETFPLFAPVTWINTNGARKKDNVETVNAIVWDMDGMTQEDMTQLLQDISCGLYFLLSFIRT